MANDIIWEDRIKGHSVIACKVPNGAIIMAITAPTWWGGQSSATWWGGLRDLEHAQEEGRVYISKNIEFEDRHQRARAAYDKVMRGL